jgi:hypothetical protein
MTDAVSGGILPPPGPGVLPGPGFLGDVIELPRMGSWDKTPPECEPSL